MEYSAIIDKTIKKELAEAYRKFPVVRKYLWELGCDKLTAEDLFQEACLIYVRKRQDQTFQLTSDPILYIRNTCKLLWFNQTRKDKKIQSDELVSLEISVEDVDFLEKEEKLVHVEKAISQIGKKCQELLEMFYGFGKSMTEIAKKLDFRNEKVAKAQKYKCLQKAKDFAFSSSQTIQN